MQMMTQMIYMNDDTNNDRNDANDGTNGTNDARWHELVEWPGVCNCWKIMRVCFVNVHRIVELSI